MATSCASDMMIKRCRFRETQLICRQAIETGFAKPCAMCKRRPRRSGERVCGRVCREQERQALQVQGSYYGVNVTRREPQTRPR